MSENRGQGAAEGQGRSPPGEPPPHLVDVRDHVSGGAPVHADLCSQGLTFLREDTHLGRADQQGHHAEPLLFQWVEEHHIPVGGRWAHPGGHCSQLAEAETAARPKIPQRLVGVGVGGCREWLGLRAWPGSAHLGEESSRITVRSGKAS